MDNGKLLGGNMLLVLVSLTFPIMILTPKSAMCLWNSEDENIK